MKFGLNLRRRWRRAPPMARWALIIIAFVLVAARLCLPFVVEGYVNRQLNRSREYGGRIGQVDVQLWRGEYRIHAIEIIKRKDGGQAPFFSASRVDFSIEWQELFHGAVVGQVAMLQPRLNFEQTQTGTNESWDKILSSLFPFKLNRMEVVGGEIHFRSPHSSPPVDIFLREVSIIATNLSNSREIRDELPAGVIARGSTVGGGGVDVRLRLNPLQEAPTYQVTAEVTNVTLTALNDFFKAYGKFDVDSGSFAMYASVAAKQGSYDGYLKVFFEHLKVFEWEKERKKNALEIFWQAIVGTTAMVLKNQFKDQLATKVPISGSYQDKSVGVWRAVGTLLRNAFIRALLPKLDNPVTIQDVEQKTEKAEHFRPETNAPAEKGSVELLKR